MKKRFQYLFLFLIGVLLFPFGVHAEGKTLTYKTTISNWKANNELYIVPATYPEGVTTSWKLVCDGVDAVTFDVEEGTIFAGVDGDCPDAEFVETVDFTNMTSVDLGLSTNNTIRPATFDQTKGVLNVPKVTNLAFSGLTTSFYPITFYSLNTVDDDGNILTGPRVQDVYFTYGEGEKTTEQNMGSILLPNYAVQFNYQVKGNIANPNGTFIVDYVQSEFVHTTNYVLNGTEEDNIAFLPIPLNWFQSFYTNPSSVFEISYGFDGEPDANYIISPIVGAESLDTIEDELEISGNTFILERDVSATLHTTNSETGLFYNIWPFAIMILFAGLFIVLFFVKKKKAKAVVIVDDEVL